MNRTRRTTTLWSLVLPALLPALGASLMAAGDSWAANPWERLSLPGATPQIFDNDTQIDVNGLGMYVTNSGSFAYNIPDQSSGLIYPKGTQKTAVYAAGLWVAGKVNGETRGAVAEYSNEFGPGTMTAGGGFSDHEDPRFRVYKISAGDTDATNPDWADWPVEDGAPVDENGDPQVLGDQTCWAVFNEADPALHDNDAARTDPMGLELQQTTFAFNRPGPLGLTIFLKWKIINKGPNTIEDTFVSMWSDPDLGGAGDDLVGCDTTLSLGYCYNATNGDNLYGAQPPAVGYDFFQGPIVPSPGDTALVSGVRVPGFRNLPMTSFNKYINGTDPDNISKTYNYMQGFDADGNVVRNPVTNEETRFSVSGDPVARSGWLDSAPADRRLMLSSGPFTMAPGDTQEVVGAVIVGQGADRLTSITALKFNDFFAQTAFDNNFDLPSPPPAPIVVAAPLNGEVTLSWGKRSETEYDEPGYAFEGYNVYQGESIAGPWNRIATYDRADLGENNVSIIFDDVFDEATGVVISKPVQFGGDSGIKYTITLDEDFVDGGPLRNGKPYYYAVTAYSYNSAAGAGLRTLENAQTPITLIPEAPAAGDTHADGPSGTTVRMQRVSGASDGFVEAVVVDPSATTGDVYEVRFSTRTDIIITPHDPDPPDTTYVEVPLWDLFNVTDNAVVLDDQENQAGDNAYLVADGILWKVTGALPGFKTNLRPNPMIDEIQTVDEGGNPVPVEPDGQGGPGNDCWWARNASGEWSLACGGGDGGVGRLLRDGANNANLSSKDILIKWDEDPDNYGVYFVEGNVAAQVPFGIYEKDPISGEETRLIVFCVSGNEGPAGTFDVEPGSVDGHYGNPCSDWIYALRLNSGTYADWLADCRDNGVMDTTPDAVELFARLVVVTRLDPPEPILPAVGTVIQFSTTKPNTPADLFRLDTAGVVFGTADLENDLDRIRVVPNPYRAHSIYELNQFDRRVKFTGLPREATVRIFNLAGDLVRTLEKPRSASSTLDWDLLTDRELPVASGVYIYHVQARDGSRTLASTTGRMAIFIEKERLNTF